MPTSEQGNRPGDGPLRYQGQALADIVPPGDLPSTVCKAAERQQPAVTLMRDVVAGTERIREAGTAYLPQAPGEDPQNYRARLLRSVFVNVTQRTVEGLVGQVFRVDPAFGDDVPAQIQEQWENIDLAGTHGDVFARAQLHDAIVAGHNGILVDFPKTDGAQNHRDESTGEIRPYWVPIKKDDILSWRPFVLNGRTYLTQLVIKECTMVPAGRFGEKEQERYRVFFHDLNAGVVGFELLEIADDKKTVLVVDQGTYPTQDEIPFAEVATSGRRGLLESVPPLLDLAYLNLTHYQTLSDYLTSIHKTCVPVWVETGIGEPDASGLVIGPNTARQFSDPAAKAYYVSHDGAALGSVRQALDDMKADMGTLGIAMLAPQKQEAETATAHRQDKGTEDSALAVTARGLQDGIERALGFHAKYLRLPSGGSITINRDFDEATMQADMLTAFTGAVTGAGVPVRFLLDAMQKGKLIPAEEDIQAVEDEVLANQEAIADKDAQRQADLLAMKQQAPKVAA